MGMLLCEKKNPCLFYFLFSKEIQITKPLFLSVKAKAIVNSFI